MKIEIPILSRHIFSPMYKKHVKNAHLMTCLSFKCSVQLHIFSMFKIKFSPAYKNRPLTHVVIKRLCKLCI